MCHLRLLLPKSKPVGVSEVFYEASCDSVVVLSTTLFFIFAFTRMTNKRCTILLFVAAPSPFHAGISTDFEPVGSPASPHGVAIMREKHDVDMTAHCSAMLSQADVLEATHIYCMAPRHHDAVRTMLPSASVASSLSAAEGGKSGKSQCSSPHDRVVASVFNPEIPDPWHGTIECYRECAERISEAVKKALEQDMPLVQDSRQQRQQVRLPASTRDQE